MMDTHYGKLRVANGDDPHAMMLSSALPRPHDLPHDLLPSLLPALRSFLTRFIRNAADAHDVAQEAAARALGAKDVPRNRKAYRVWLYQIARHVAIDAHRRRRLPEAVEAEPIDPWSADRSLISAISVRQALMRISDDQRRVLLLVDVEGLGYAEAATRLGIPPGTVMSRVARARAALLAIIGHDDSQGAATE